MTPTERIHYVCIRLEQRARKLPLAHQSAMARITWSRHPTLGHEATAFYEADGVIWGIRGAHARVPAATDEAACDALCSIIASAPICPIRLPGTEECRTGTIQVEAARTASFYSILLSLLNA